jgi:hypothetical protein
MVDNVLELFSDLTLVSTFRKNADSSDLIYDSSMVPESSSLTKPPRNS